MVCPCLLCVYTNSCKQVHVQVVAAKSVYVLFASMAMCASFGSVKTLSKCNCVSCGFHESGFVNTELIVAMQHSIRYV